MSDPAQDPASVAWASPDGAIAGAPGTGPAEALAAGWLRLSRGPGDAWELDVGDGPVTLAAVEAVTAEARRLGTPVPKGLSERYLALARSAWDADRDPTPADTVARLARKVDHVRFVAAVDAAYRERGFPSPDAEAARRALAGARAAATPLYDLAHGWRSGPGPDLGPYSRDPDRIAAGIAANARAILDRTAILQSALRDMRLAARGLDAAAPALPPPEGGSLPGEQPGAALRRLAGLVRAETDASVASRRVPRPEGPLAAAAEALYAAVYGTHNLVAGIERHAESALVGIPRRAGQAEALSNLGGWHLAHECGRTALDLRHRLERFLPDRIAAVRVAERAVAAEAGSLPACPPGR